MKTSIVPRPSLVCGALVTGLFLSGCGGSDNLATPAPAPAPAPDTGPAFVAREVPANAAITPADCTAAKAGTTIDPALIGEPVRAVTLDAPVWVAAAGNTPAHCRVQGTMAAVDTAASNINFAVVLPAVWAHRAGQQGGSGTNGSIPNLSGNLQRGWAAYASDSGHQGANMTWALRDEAVKNFGYMQIKKTHDAAWVLIQRMYGSKPVYSYFVGNSQGGREAITAVQRYSQDYDGVVSTVPVLSFSTLAFSRALQRIQEVRAENWVPPAKVAAVANEVIRQCDKLDGLADGILGNYMACRDKFDARKSPDAWNFKRCPGGAIDPNPGDTTASACLTDGQIATLKFTYSPYRFANPLAHNTTSYGMYVPSVTPDAEATITGTRYLGQQGAGAGAAVFSWQGGQIVVPALWGDSNADPLTYVEGGPLDARRRLLSEWVDSTDPDLRAFYNKGGKLIMAAGTGDYRASSGAQLDYYNALYAFMGKDVIDRFSRLFVYPHVGHDLSGSNFAVNGDGSAVAVQPIPTTVDHVGNMVGWVEKNVAPAMTLTATSGDRSLPLCSYPKHPHYKGGGLPVGVSTSYECTE